MTVNDRKEKESKGLVLHSLPLLVSVYTAMVGGFSACFSLVLICSLYLGKDEHMVVGEILRLQTCSVKGKSISWYRY